MNENKCEAGIRCPVEACLSMIGGKWKGVILYQLLYGTKRFNELRRAMPSVTQRMLTKQLRDLEADEIVERTVYHEVPPKVEYSLTEFGKTLEPILIMLQKWGLDHFERITNLRRGDSEDAAIAVEKTQNSARG